MFFYFIMHAWKENWIWYMNGIVLSHRLHLVINEWTRLDIMKRSNSAKDTKIWLQAWAGILSIYRLFYRASRTRAGQVNIKAYMSDLALWVTYLSYFYVHGPWKWLQCSHTKLLWFIGVYCKCNIPGMQCLKNVHMLSLYCLYEWKWSLWLLTLNFAPRSLGCMCM